ncbi:MAG: hypothetical protein QS721_15635 [Candidatus Endonucleobacter sp. (ex Gigantidas childressi)]|nr:hypothetical protein [Candidatus Endonucleobacter sp. (ex Gigantidas childressi)]
MNSLQLVKALSILREVTDITIGGAVGFIDSASISNFTVSRSMVLFEGKRSNVQIGFCMGDNKDGISKCDFDETKKIFDNSPYNDTNGVSHHQYNYNMNLTNQCKGSKLPFIGNDCEIKPEEYCRYKEPLIMVWNAPCLTQAPEQATTVPTIATWSIWCCFYCRCCCWWWCLLV